MGYIFVSEITEIPMSLNLILNVYFLFKIFLILFVLFISLNVYLWLIFSFWNHFTVLGLKYLNMFPLAL